MIRFVDLKDQIYGWCDHFAFYNTITDNFISFDGCAAWNSLKDFDEWATGLPRYEQCREHIPDGWKGQEYE